MSENSIATRKMKHSGVEWIGEIPEDRRIIRNKYALSFIKGKIPSEINTEQKGIPYIGASDLDTLSGNANYLLYTSDVNVPMCNSEDVLVLWDGARAGLIGKNHTGAISSTIVKITPDQFINKHFFFWYLKGFEKYLYECVNGTTIPHMNKKYVEDIMMIDWSLDDQKHIADFLDDKCVKIDRYIEKQQKIIDKLKEYKQAVITEAVTKGLDPDAPMKDSGIEWIGMIPEHWGVAKLANLFTFLGGYAFNSDLYVSETENLIVRIGNVKNDRLLFDANPVYISDDLAEQVIKFKLQCGDILFTMTGTKGKRDYFYTLILDNFHIQTKNLYLNQRVGCFRKKAHIHAEYYNYLLKDNRILDSIFLYETGTANQGNLGIDSINRTKVHLPPYDEQIMIANYLKEKCSRIDAVIAKKEVAINKSTEYKKSLIYEAVTGKLEV